MPGLFDYFVNKLKPAQERKNPGRLVPINRYFDEQTDVVPVKEPIANPFSFPRVLPPVEKETRTAVDTFRELPYDTIEQSKNPLATYKIDSGNVRGFNFLSPNLASDVLQEQSLKTPTTQPFVLPTQPRQLFSPSSLLFGNSLQTSTNNTMPSVSVERNGVSAPGDIMQDYYKSSIANTLAGINAYRQRLDELQDTSKNPIVNNDRGIKGRLLDIFRQFVISAGEAFGKSDGPPQLRLAQALGAGIAGGTYGGFHPTVDEERKRMFDIQRASQNLESYQQQLENLSKSNQEYSKSFFDIQKAYAELNDSAARAAEIEQKIKSAKTEDERKLLETLWLREKDLYNLRLQTLNSLITAAGLTGENTTLNAASSVILKQLGLPSTDRPLKGAQSPGDIKIVDTQAQASIVKPDAIYVSPYKINPQFGNKMSTTTVNINELPAEIGDFLRGLQDSIINAQKDPNNPVPGLNKFIDDAGNINFQELAKANFVFPNEMNLSPVLQLLRASGVRPGSNGQYTSAQLVAALQDSITDEADKVSMANAMTQFINQIPPENRPKAIAIARSIISLQDKNARVQAFNKFMGIEEKKEEEKKEKKELKGKKQNTGVTDKGTANTQ